MPDYKESKEETAPISYTQAEAEKLFFEELDKRNTHRALMARMKARGYAIDDGLGVCSGITGLGMQAFSLGEEGLSKYKKRIALLLNTSVKAFAEEAARESKGNKLPETTPGFFKYNIQHQEKFRDFTAFFDTLSLYQGSTVLLNPKDLTGHQSPLNATPLTIPQPLQEQGHFVLAHRFLDTYRQEKLVSRLDELKVMQMKYPQKPLSLRLVSTNHVLFVGYQADKKHWIIIETSNDDLEGYSCEGTEEIAEKIICAFSPNKATDFHHIRTMQEDLRKDPALQNLNAHLRPSPLEMQCGDFSFQYDPGKKEFSLMHANPENWAIFSTEIYTISTIENQMADRLQGLAGEYKEQKADEPLAIDLQHSEHSLHIEYDGGEDLWALFHEEGYLAGTTKSSAQLAHWIISEFSTANNHSIISIELCSSLEPKSSFSLTDKTVQAIIQDLSSIQGVRDAPIEATHRDVHGASLLHLASQHGYLDAVESLLPHHEDVHLPTFKGIHPLFMAAQNGYAEIVRRLLQVPVQDPQILNNALMAAATKGQLPVIKLLLQYGVNPNQTGKGMDGLAAFPLCVAAQQGHVEVVQTLFAYDPYPQRVFSALMLASLAGHLPVVEFFLQEEVDPNQPGQDGKGQEILPLLAATQNGHMSLVKRLLTCDPESNLVDSALLVAAQQGHVDIAKHLLTYELEEPTIPSALMVASMHGMLSVVDLLLAQGDYANTPGLAENGSYFFPLVMAAQQNHLEVVQRLLSYNPDEEILASALMSACAQGHSLVVELLLQQPGIDVNKAGKAVNGSYYAPLFMAAENNQAEIVASLLAFEPDAQVLSSALMIASYLGHNQIMELLLKQPNVKIDKPGQGANGANFSPLLAAVMGQQIRSIALLLSQGADPEEKNGNESPLAIAQKQGQDEILLLFQAAVEKRALEKQVPFSFS